MAEATNLYLTLVTSLLIEAINLGETEIAVSQMVFLFSPHHGHCKRHGNTFAIPPVGVL